MCALSRVWLFVTPWTVALQAPLSKKFPGNKMEWVAISYCGASSWPRDQTHVSCVFCIGKWILISEPPGMPPNNSILLLFALWTFLRL